MPLHQARMLKEITGIYATVQQAQHERYSLLVSTKLDTVTATLLSLMHISDETAPDAMQSMRKAVCDILAYGDELKRTENSEVVDRVLEVEDGVHALCAEFLYRGEILGARHDGDLV
jgi:hypothetical protein